MTDSKEFLELIKWYKVEKRPPTEEEKTEFAARDIGDIPYVLTGPMPEDGQEILIATSYGVSTDTCQLDYDYGYSLEEEGDWDEVIAWAPMPGEFFKLYKNNEDDFWQHLKLLPLAKLQCEETDERKHGNWILIRTDYMADNGWTYNVFSCNQCGRQIIGGRENYCPNCGADMRERKDSE